MTDPNRPESPEDELPQDVVAALRTRYGPAGTIPEQRDEAVLQDAAAHLSQLSTPQTGKRTSQRSRHWVAWSAGTLIAAGLLIAVLPLAPQEPELRQSVVATAAPEAMEELLRGDIDRNGTVNILDAFALARDVQTGQPLSDEWDQNGDGRTDRLDIKLIAQSAVTL